MSNRSPQPQFSGLHYLNSLPLWEKGAFSPLEVPVRLLSELGNPQASVATVHVAGSNGKGTVCAAIAAMLHCSGAAVGHFASPHLTEVEERCLIDGIPIARADFDRSLLRVKKAAEKIDCQPSYFVATAAASFVEFQRRELDWQVIEVGLGGRFDATNVIAAPKLTIITSISFDHTAHLGNSLAEIAWNKAGIIKTGVPVIVAPVPEEAGEVIRREAEKLNAPIEFLGKEFSAEIDRDGIARNDSSGFILERTASFNTRHQRENLRLAIRAAELLGLSQAEISAGLSRMNWPGRGELLSILSSRVAEVFGAKTRTPTAEISLLLDAGHNVAGIEALFEHLDRVFDQKGDIQEVVFVFSVLQQKDWRSMLEQLKSGVEQRSGKNYRWIFTSSGNVNAVSPTDLQSYFGQAEAIVGAKAALSAAFIGADSRTLVVVNGSIYLLGEVRPLLTDSPFCTIRPKS